jgi:hypothetical protein
VRTLTGGGGGDLKRPSRDRVRTDLTRGYISAVAAREVYGLDEPSPTECDVNFLLAKAVDKWLEASLSAAQRYVRFREKRKLSGHPISVEIDPDATLSLPY